MRPVAANGPRFPLMAVKRAPRLMPYDEADRGWAWKRLNENTLSTSPVADG